MSERNKVRLAFAKAIRFIIDLEDAYSVNDDAKPAKLRPLIEWFNWGIAGPSVISGDGVDPMVPYDDYDLIDPDDEVL
ncbi:hypothetical protein AJ80_03352 [Polytolypa hystricis UAMH7299]|uniref:Uncharacterized protein n=1 Tax=Polytolypa hystricis (strain UAMH7299) TaxID=1447883 RepID=A0A2B7YKC7_POLH7|nr:hypothetical protein AJ80_03352 [Polytolypa hystricis UAMH7299]